MTDDKEFLKRELNSPQFMFLRKHISEKLLSQALGKYDKAKNIEEFMAIQGEVKAYKNILNIEKVVKNNNLKREIA
jgi:hypothetical protein